MIAKDQASPEVVPTSERDVLRLSAREWLLVLAGVLAILAIFPAVGIRKRAAVVEADYRMPYSLSHRYRLYQHYTTLACLQYPTLLLGDSVVWGQCAQRNRTLSHFLNKQAGADKVANAGLDAMHPIALEGLLEYHAPSISRKSVLLQFNPMWLMQESKASAQEGDPLRNRPNLLPRLAPASTAWGGREVEASWSRICRMPPWGPWIDRTLNAQLDFLAWSVSHPYESPLEVLRSTLPPSEDAFSPRLFAWNAGSDERAIECTWPDPGTDRQWQAYERTIERLESRGNRVLVIVGPLNEHMLTRAARESYRRFTAAVADRLRIRGTAFYIPPLLASQRYADICHPLAQGYEEFAKILWRDQRDWLVSSVAPR